MIVLKFWNAIDAMFLFSFIALFFNRRKGKVSSVITGVSFFLALLFISIAGGMVETLKILMPVIFDIRVIAGLCLLGFVGWMVWLHGYAKGRRN